MEGNLVVELTGGYYVMKRCAMVDWLLDGMALSLLLVDYAFLQHTS